MDLTNERAVRLKEEEELEVQLVEPLTKLQLLGRWSNIKVRKQEMDVTSE